MLGGCDLIALVGTTDLARARAFYGDSLGLSLTGENPLAYLFQANGVMLRVTLVPEIAPASYTVLGWRVADIHGAVRELSGRGVDFTYFEGMGQDEDGVWSAPGGDKVAWFKDPDGNTLSLTQLAGD